MVILLKTLAILKILMITILLIPGSIPAIIIGLGLFINRDRDIMRPHSV